MLYLPAFLMVSQYFEKRRALATGISCCGSGVGSFVFAPFSVYILDTYGWKISIWIIAAMSVINIVFALFHRPLPEETDPKLTNQTEDNDLCKTTNNNQEDKYVISTIENQYQSVCETTNKTNQQIMDISNAKNVARQVSTRSQKKDTSLKQAFVTSIKQSFDFTLLYSPTFLIYVVSCFLCMFGFFTPFTYLPAIADDLGLDKNKGAMLISIIGIANTVGRVGIGLICDQPWANPLVINNVVLILGGVATIAVPYYKTFWMLCVYSVVFGTAIGKLLFNYHP